ncbi:TetR/AcrR family transcriptional regulator [Streptomyces sp. R39]|uniref:TetR/AcrR family transcriptional regulator n=1 Tax=Streptomyces sp. R39 TaxID=3238631 RepID=A0AB39QXD7_9ACTN
MCANKSCTTYLPERAAPARDRPPSPPLRSHEVVAGRRLPRGVLVARPCLEAARDPGRGLRQGDESRRAILEATLEIAARNGYDGTTVAAVTEATGLPASSIYWHFRSKDALLAATLEFSYREWRALVPTWSGPVENGSVAEEVEARFQRAAVSLTSSPEFWSLGLLLTLQQRIKEPAARRLYAEVRQNTETEITDWWVRVLRPEAVTEDPRLPRRLARFHMMLMDGLFMHVRSTGGRDVKRVVSLVALGLAEYLSRTGAAA